MTRLQKQDALHIMEVKGDTLKYSMNEKMMFNVPFMAEPAAVTVPPKSIAHFILFNIQQPCKVSNKLQ